MQLFAIIIIQCHHVLCSGGTCIKLKWAAVNRFSRDVFKRIKINCKIEVCENLCPYFPPTVNCKYDAGDFAGKFYYEFCFIFVYSWVKPFTPNITFVVRSIETVLTYCNHYKVSVTLCWHTPKKIWKCLYSNDTVTRKEKQVL